MIVDMPDYVFDSIVGLVTDTLDCLDEENFDSRREYLGYVAELSEILEFMR